MVVPAVPEYVFHHTFLQCGGLSLLFISRLFEDHYRSAIDSRTESLQSLRELGPPDLIHIIKQPVRSTTKHVSPRPHTQFVESLKSSL